MFNPVGLEQFFQGTSARFLRRDEQALEIRFPTGSADQVRTDIQLAGTGTDIFGNQCIQEGGECIQRARLPLLFNRQSKQHLCRQEAAK